MRAIILISAALMAVTGCTTESVVDTGEWESAPATASSTVPAAPQLPPTNPDHLADAANFSRDANGKTAYYFATPSGRWQCAILPRDKAGCEATGGALSIAGAPDGVQGADGTQTPPNAIVVAAHGDAGFSATDAAQFAPPTPANVLPFNKTLAVSGFRCNIQESRGVSCVSETSGKGFTFSADGFDLQYGEVPLDAS
jgi:hypothetical protein